MRVSLQHHQHRAGASFEPSAQGSFRSLARAFAYVLLCVRTACTVASGTFRRYSRQTYISYFYEGVLVPQRTGELENNGYSVAVSAEEYRSVNERVPHHRVVSGVLRDAQT